MATLLRYDTTAPVERSTQTLASTAKDGRTNVFSFLTLPGEIRNQILRLVLTHRTQIVIHSFSMFRPPCPVTLGLATNILRTCKKVYHEGRSILYGENTFQAHPTLLTGITFALDSSLPLTLNCVALVRRFHIRVRADSDPFYHPSQVEAAFNNAEILEVEVFRSSFDVGDDAALQCFIGVRGVNSAKVHGSIGDSFARWIERCMMRKAGDSLAESEASYHHLADRTILDTRVR